MMRALVVDDDRTMVETISDILELRGWDVMSAHSGEDAIVATATHPFDCVIMDVKMGGVDGVNALQRIRQYAPELPVVLMTAYSTYELIAEAEREGVLVRIPDLRDVDEVASQMAAHMASGGSAAFMSALTGACSELETSLREKGCEVRTARSPQEVTAAFGLPDGVAVVWNIHLPVVPIKGAVVAYDIKPGALLAVWGVDENQLGSGSEQFTAHLGCGYLQKPFEIDHLLATIDVLAA